MSDDLRGIPGPPLPAGGGWAYPPIGGWVRDPRIRGEEMRKVLAALDIIRDFVEKYAEE